MPSSSSSCSPATVVSLEHRTSSFHRPSVRSFA
uniref:Uncharacterized protein n=1 Tax=Zea mays TaxID=4577 RepID=C4J5W0_MAIZE|nr:unknown [Zea mays]